MMWLDQGSSGRITEAFNRSVTVGIKGVWECLGVRASEEMLKEVIKKSDINWWHLDEVFFFLMKSQNTSMHFGSNIKSRYM